MSALAGFEVVGCGEEEGWEVRAEVVVFGGEVVGVLGGGEGQMMGRCAEWFVIGIGRLV